MSKQVYFVVAVEFDGNGNPTSTFVDDWRATAVFDGEDVWDTTTEAWESVGEAEDLDTEELYAKGNALLNLKLA
jgi:hypothetical protein